MRRTSVNRSSRLAIAALAATTGLSLATAVNAATYDWASPTSGVYSTAGNWLVLGSPPANAPGSGDSVIFHTDDATPYTVTFTGNATTTGNASRYNADNVTLDLGGFTYTVATLNEGTSTGATGGLTITNGTVEATAASAVYVGSGAAGRVGSLTVDTGGNLNAVGTPTHNLMIGNSGATGTLTVQNGGDGSGAVRIGGNSTTGTGTMTLDGSGTTWAGTGSFYIGGYAAGTSTGTLNVQNNAVLTASSSILLGHMGDASVPADAFNITSGGTVTQTAGTLRIAEAAGRNDSMLVSGSTSSYTGVTTYVGPAIAGAGGGTLTINAGGSFSTGALGLNVHSTGTVVLNKSNVTTGLLNITGGKLDVSNLANNITGPITLDAASTTTMHLAGDLDYGRLTGDGTSTFTKAGTLDVVLDGGYNPSGGDSYTLFSGWASPFDATSFDTVNLPTLGGGLTWNTSLLESSGIISVEVPEPTALGLLAVGGLLAMRRRRRSA